jgi:hypothetical protein
MCRSASTGWPVPESKPWMRCALARNALTSAHVLHRPRFTRPGRGLAPRASRRSAGPGRRREQERQRTRRARPLLSARGLATCRRACASVRMHRWQAMVRRRQWAQSRLGACVLSIERAAWHAYDHVLDRTLLGPALPRAPVVRKPLAMGCVGNAGLSTAARALVTTRASAIAADVACQPHDGARQVKACQFPSAASHPSPPCPRPA